VAREIHDTLLQGFAGVTLELGAIARTSAHAQEAARQRLERVLGQMDECLTEARRSIRASRSPRLEIDGLPAAITHVAQQLTESSLLRIAQEGIANAVKYAQASPEVMQAGDEEHLGLIRMRERAGLIGGRFSVRSTPGRRKQIAVMFPRHHG